MRFYMPLPYYRFNKYRFALFFLLIISVFTFGQSRNAKPKMLSEFNGPKQHKSFIQNIGQYGDTLKSYSSIGKIQFAYDGFDLPVLFTNNGILFLQRQIERPSEHEKEALERNGVLEEVIEQKVEVTDRVIALKFIGANQNPKLVYSDKLETYQTFGFLIDKASQYKQVKYTELYPGIDMVLSFNDSNVFGFKYSFIVHPGADYSQIKFKYSGDLDVLRIDRKGGLYSRTDINDLYCSAPLSFTENSFGITGDFVNSSFQLSIDTLSFKVGNYDNTKTLIIDPFVSSSSNLTGANSGIAKDVDYDYNGNVYVTGGGDGSIYKLAKYSPSGTLLWTFNGSLAVPSWNFGTYYGGWVVDKTNGSVYLGQGFAPGGGFRIIRINTNGVYDNYISTANPNFLEDWKMLWSCNNGAPQIVIAGGGTNSNINLGVCSPPSTSISGINITGVAYSGATGWAQDISDIIIDPVNNDLYTIYGSLIGTPTITNRIYKNTFPYSSASMTWNVASGYASIQEIANRPYLVAGQMDNSSNILAVNKNYFFYYDGRNLKAFNKSTGATVGTPLVLTGNTALMQGGIVADECNNIFIGSSSGTIKVYTFNGTVFNDSTADIAVSGYSSNGVYDLAYSDAQKMLYVSGNGFVATYNVASYACPSNVYTLSVGTSCANQTATASLSPSAPSGSTITYVLYTGTTRVNSNQTGVFTGLVPNLSYTMYAYINQACSGSEAIKTFVIAGPNLSSSQTNATCGNSNGSITVTGSGGVGTLKYCINGGAVQNNGNFSGLSAGVYTILVSDSLGCSSNLSISLINSNGPIASAAITHAFCGSNTGKLTLSGTGGVAPYMYAINNGTYSSSNVISNLAAGTYLLMIKDSNNCVNVQNVSILNAGNAVISKVSLSSSCGNSNGSVTLSVSGGTAPYLYAYNSGSYQSNNVFAGLSAGNYVFLIKDSNNCVSTIVDTIRNVAGPQFTSTVTSSSCNGSTGSIAFSVTSGTAPFRYSINGGSSFQSAASFTGLAAGVYNLMVMDVNNCQSKSVVTLNKTLPQVTDSTTLAGCNTFSGSIRAIGTGGTSPYQYSINGTTYQNSNLFSGLRSGNYTLYIKDSVGCVSSISPVYVDNASGLRLNGTTTVSACVGNTGSIVLTAMGGKAPLRYSLDSVTYQNSNTFSSLASGTYNAFVKDSNGCIAKITLQVRKLSSPTLTAASVSTSCNNNNGSIIGTAIGGKTPYTYSINGSTFFSSNTFKTVSAGTYTMTVKDSNLCTATASITVSNVGGGSGPTVTASTTDAECGQSNGRINGNGSGGKNPKKYSIDGINFQGSTNFSKLPPGTYTLTVMDDNGCTNSITVVVGNSPGPQVSAIDSATLCGSSTGKITLSGSGGTAPYEYSINNGVSFQTGNVFSNLSAGYYTITVRDNDKICNNSIVVKISSSNGPSVSASKVDATCGNNNGKITASSTGGTGSIQYSLDGVFYQSSNLFVGLTPGQYAVYAKDSTGCINSTSINVGSIAAPSVSATQLNAYCSQSNGSILATGRLGAAPYRYSIDGITFKNSNSFTGLAAGNYVVTLKDTNACLVTTNVNISNIAGPQMSSTKYNSACGNANGAIKITGRNGTMPYQFSLNGISYQNSFLFPYLSQGTYYLTLKDSANCVVRDTIVLGNTAGPTLTLNEDTTNCAPGKASIVASLSGGTSAYLYSIDSVVYQNSNRFNCVNAGIYKVYVKDANACPVVNTIQINGVPLAASLLDFKASPLVRKVECTWISIMEENSSYYEVEHSMDGINWKKVGQVKAIGNSNQNQNYSLLDEHPFLGLSFYRLIETDLFGKKSISETREVYFSENNKLQASPNPAQTSLSILIGTSRGVEFKVVNALGQVVDLPWKIMEDRIELDVRNLANGLYQVQILQFGKTDVISFTVLN